MPMPRSNPSRITYMATAVPIRVAQITGRYHSMALDLFQCAPAGVRRGGNRATAKIFGLFDGGSAWTLRDQPVHVINAHREHDAVNNDEQRQRESDTRVGHRRGGV